MSGQPNDYGDVMSGPTRETRLVEALVTLADTLVGGYDLVELMHYLVDVSVELLDAAAAGLVLADGDGQLEVLASTSERTELLEVLQIRTGRGPCHDCYTTGEPQTIRDVSAEADRWPQFAPLALEQGYRSVHAVPMRHRVRTIGALNLFRSEPGELTEADRRAAQALADVATIGVLQQRAARETAELNEQLEYALASRVVIEQAKGILAQYGGLTMDEAFVHLRRFARNHRLELTGMAQELVDRQRTPTDILPSGVDVLPRMPNPPLGG
jgi:GAF domain-containing protein